MAYHPQSDGTTEWVNQEIEAYISIFCTNNPEEWMRIPILCLMGRISDN